VAGEILQHRFRHGTPLSDFAILYRGNHQARPFEKALRTHNLPYFVSGGTAFFSRTEIKDLMAYLRLLNNTDDDAALLRVINTPRREIGHGTIQKLAAWAGERHCSLFDAIDALGLQQQLSSRPLHHLLAFREWIIGLQRLATHQTPSRVLEQLLSDIDYRDWLGSTSASDKTAERRWENVQDLVQWLERLQADEHKGETLAELVAHLSLMDILERQDEDEAGERIALMTLHAAKGLEFPVVFLVGVEEGLLPHQTSIEEDGLEEERRLTYVGITRARRELLITTAKKRRRAGEWVRCEPSRFLRELPPEDLQCEGVGVELSEEERLERGRAGIAGLRAILGDRK
jgi:ATP-dependent DNA helicase Rep